MFKSIIVAGIGGFVGTCLRFLSETLGALLCPGAFPLGTFIANVVGCYLIGLFYGWATKTNRLSHGMNLFLITGLCGGFTTFSSLSDELVDLLQAGNALMFTVYLGSTIILGLLMVILGIACVKGNNKQLTTQESHD